MGDRSNVFIQQYQHNDSWSGVGIYSHYYGKELHDIALKHLDFAKGRVGDVSYFTRILVQNILNEIAASSSLTGAGIWTTVPDDNSYPVLVINAQTGNYHYVDTPEGVWRNG